MYKKNTEMYMTIFLGASTHTLCNHHLSKGTFLSPQKVTLCSFPVSSTPGASFLEPLEMEMYSR